MHFSCSSSKLKFCMRSRDNGNILNQKKKTRRKITNRAKIQIEFNIFKLALADVRR